MSIYYGKCPKCQRENMELIPVGIKGVVVPVEVCADCMENEAALRAWGRRQYPNRFVYCGSCQEECYLSQCHLVNNVHYCFRCFENLFVRTCIWCNSVFRVKNLEDKSLVCDRCENLRNDPLMRRCQVSANAANSRSVHIGKITAIDVYLRFLVQGGKCQYCGCELALDFHLDHVVPLSRQGLNSPENIVVACPPCNLSKHNTPLEEWLRKRR